MKTAFLARRRVPDSWRVSRLRLVSGLGLCAFFLHSATTCEIARAAEAVVAEPVVAGELRHANVSSTRMAQLNAARPATDVDVDPQLVQSIAEKVKPALVRIHVVESSTQEGREVRSEGFGSGVIVTPDGYAVTNHHVAGDATWLSVTLSSKETVDAKLVGTDPLSDLAVIKLEPRDDGQPYSVAQWGNSDTLRVGETVLAMGSPFAFSQSVTAGIISNTELVMADDDEFTLAGEQVGSIVRWIGHDAPIHPGNSGGPLVNLRGEIIGINEIAMGLSGAIPGNLARDVSTQIIEKGHVTRAYTGLDLQPRLRSDSHTTGALVGGVLPNSPAQKAGIKPGDLLLSINGEALDVRFSEQLPLANLQLARLSLNQPSTLEIERGGEKMTLTLQPRLRDAVMSPDREVKGLGLTGMNITPPIALEYKYPNTDGVIVTTVQDGGPAGSAKPSIEEGDVILAVREKPVKNLAELRAIIGQIARKEGGTPTLIEVRRRGERVLAVANVSPESTEDASVEVAKAYLPVSTQVVTEELVQALKLPAGTQGVRITQVHPNSAASGAGLRVGDVIVKLDGLEVEASQEEDTDIFPAMIRQYKIGSWARVAILRRDNGKWRPKLVGVKLPQAPKAERELASYRDTNFGIAMRSVTYTDRLRQDANPGEDGALVTGVDEGSWAALGGLETGDIIHRINGVEVNNMEEARTQLRLLEKQKPRRAVFFVARGVRTLFVELQTDWGQNQLAGGSGSNQG